MAGPDLKVTDADFENAIEGLARTKSGFESMKSVGDELAKAVGHPGLASACTDFISQWSVNRDRIQRAIDAHLKLLRTTKEAFDKVEQESTQKPTEQETNHPKPKDGEQPKPGEGGGTGQSAPSGGGGGGTGGGSAGGGGGTPTVSSAGGGAILGGTETGSAKGVNQVSGGGGGASLGGTQTEEHPDANQVGNAGTKADLGKDLPPGTKDAKVVDGTGDGGHLGDATTDPHKDPNRIDDTPANAAIQKELKEKGLPVFAVDGQVQRPLGKVDGIGTLLGSQDEPPTISAVVDSKGKVVDIADLKPEYDEKGNLIGLNQVPVKPGDLTGSQAGLKGEDGKLPGIVDGSAPKAPALDSRTQEAMNKVKELFGDLVDVALSGGAGGGDPTLTVAGVSGIGLAALATLATLSRSGGTDPSTGVNLADGRGSLRDSFGDIAPENRDGFGQRQATDRKNLIDTLLKDLDPELGPQAQRPESSGSELREALAGAGKDDSSKGPGLGTGLPLPDDLPSKAGEELRASLAASPGSKGDLGGALPAGSSAGLGDALGVPTGSTSSGGPLDLGGPLPGGSTHQPGVEGPNGASSTTADASAAVAKEEVSKERRNAHMMGGMGMAAGMSAAGGRGGLTGAEEARRNDEARRLRDRLMSSKENN